MKEQLEKNLKPKNFSIENKEIKNEINNVFSLNELENDTINEFKSIFIKFFFENEDKEDINNNLLQREKDNIFGHYS